MSKEKTAAQKLQEELFYTPKPAVDEDPEALAKAEEFSKGYMAFLDAAKTEREAAAISEKMLKEAGYQPFEPGKTYPGGGQGLHHQPKQVCAGRHYRPAAPGKGVPSEHRPCGFPPAGPEAQPPV